MPGSIFRSSFTDLYIGRPKLVSTIKLPESSALSLAQTSDYIFVGLPSGKIRVWQSQGLKHCRDLEGHTGSVLGLLVVEQHRRKHWLVSASADSTVRIWDARSLKPLWTIFAPYDAIGDILSVTFVGNRVAFGTQSCAILWIELPDRVPEPDAVSTPPPEGRYNKFFDSQDALSLSRAQALAHGQLYSSLRDLSLVSSRSSTESNAPCDTPSIATSAARCITVDHEDILLSAHYGYVYALDSYKPEAGPALISGSGDGTVKVWTCNKHGFVYDRTILDEDNDAVLALAIKDKVTLYAGLQGGSVRIIDLATFTTIRTLSTGLDDVISLSKAGDNCIVMTAGGILQTWNKSFLLEDEIVAHEGIALSCTSAANGQMLYTGGNDGTLKVWQVKRVIVASEARSEALQGRLFSLLAEFVAYQSISSSPNHREETAIWCKDALANLGADATLLPGMPDRNPLVLAKFIARNRPPSKRKRVLFYGHYDVVSDLGKWKSGDPFNMTGIDGYLYGRGVIDNKGPIIAVACAVADLLEAGQLDVDVLMLLEGEEEVDSAGLKEAVQQHTESIGPIDAVLVSNSYSLSEDIPSIMFGLRGRLNLTVTVSSPNPDLHSGMHGGICYEPLADLTRVLGSLIDAQSGDVAVEGFYDLVRPLEKLEEEAYDEIIRRLPSECLDSFAKHSKYDDPKLSLINSWRKPSLSIHKIGVSGSSISTVIPKEAWAMISIRTVPDMHLRSIAASVAHHLEAEFAKSTGSSNKIKVTVDSSAPWWIADRQHAFSRAAEQAVFDEWKIHPLWIREGGSLPSLPFLESHFNACTVHLPMGCQGDHAHLVDEKTSIVNLQRGKKVVENWLRALPTVDKM